MIKYLVLLLCFAIPAIGQESSEKKITGKVIDAKTGKAIKAAIRYSSIPTGSIFGRFNDSTFAFSVFGSAKYQITAEAAGYNPYTVIIDPGKVTGPGIPILRDIILTRKGETIVLDHLIFAQGKSDIASSSFEQLDEVVQFLKENPKIEIQLEGHTDNTGNQKANLELSQARVDAVKKYLVNKGIAKNRIQTQAFGGSKPLRNEMTPEERVKNRRVEMRILKQ